VHKKRSCNTWAKHFVVVVCGICWTTTFKLRQISFFCTFIGFTEKNSGLVEISMFSHISCKVIFPIQQGRLIFKHFAKTYPPKRASDEAVDSY
jgi:hypothetical protein